MDHPKDDVLQRFLKTAGVCTEEQLFRASVDMEPPDKHDQARTMQRLKYVAVCACVCWYVVVCCIGYVVACYLRLQVKKEEKQRLWCFTLVVLV